jgi:hypothetical protein
MVAKKEKEKILNTALDSTHPGQPPLYKDVSAAWKRKRRATYLKL